MMQSKRLTFSDVKISDAADFMEYMQRPDYSHFIPMELPSREGLERYLQSCALEQKKTPRWSFFMAARLLGNPKVIGEAVINLLPNDTSCGEIGWAVHGDYLGDGIASEIGSALLSFGFINLKLHRIQARCHPENLASIRIMNKLGMKAEGLIREHIFSKGVWWSSYQASILETEFSKIFS